MAQNRTHSFVPCHLKSTCYTPVESRPFRLLDLRSLLPTFIAPNISIVLESRRPGAKSHELMGLAKCRCRMWCTGCLWFLCAYLSKVLISISIFTAFYHILSIQPSKRRYLHIFSCFEAKVPPWHKTCSDFTTEERGGRWRMNDRSLETH